MLNKKNRGPENKSRGSLDSDHGGSKAEYGKRQGLKTGSALKREKKVQPRCARQGKGPQAE